jgi:flagellar motor switch protein FliN
MVKNDDAGQENTQIDDLDAFEEWEAGEEMQPEESPEAPAVQDDQGATEEVVSEEELAFEGLGEEGAVVEAPPEEGQQEAPPPASEEEFSEGLLDLAPDVPVNLVAVIGKTTTTVGDLMRTRVGGVIDLGRPPGETIDLVANGRLIARGELVEMDGQLGVRILKMVK